MNIFITGATSGIGLELAKHYLERGHRVAITGRTLAKLPASFQQDYKNVVCYEVDVCDAANMKRAMEEFREQGLDLVIANAGISDGRKTEIPDFVRARQIMQTNVIGVINTFEPAVEYFLQQKRGHLVAIASVAAFIGVPGTGPYCGSKAAVVKMCESLTIDLKKYGVDVTTICPGFIDTPLTRQNSHAMPFLMGVERGARIIARAIAKKKKLYLFPWPMAFVITFLNKIPRFLYRFIMARVNYAKESS